MIITLTKEELDRFQSDLQSWYSQLITYVLEKVQINRMTNTFERDQLHQLRVEFKKKNPKPDWRFLL
jgi:hypothetical protein